MTRWTQADVDLLNAKRAGKAAKSAPAKQPRVRGAQKTEVDGLIFHSQKEATRYRELKLEEHIGAISNLRLQVPFSLAVNRVHVAVYVADFVFVRDGKEIVEDVKGWRTETFRLKKRLMFAVHSIEVIET